MNRNQANKVIVAINNEFAEQLKRAFKGKFWLDIETNFNLIGFAMVSTRVDEKPFTQAQADFIAAFEAGYFAARHMAATALEAK